MVHNSRTNIFPDMPFLQNDSSEQYSKIRFPEKSNDKISKKLINFIGLLFQIFQENPNTAKKSGFPTFLS